MLIKASEIGTNKKVSPKERLLARRETTKNSSEDIISFAIDNGLNLASEKYSYSKTSIAKMAIKKFKKENIEIDSLISKESISNIEEYLFSQNSTSIKKLCLGSNYSESEIRIVKAIIEKRDNNSWQ